MTSSPEMSGRPISSTIASARVVLISSSACFPVNARTVAKPRGPRTLSRERDAHSWSFARRTRGGEPCTSVNCAAMSRGGAGDSALFPPPLDAHCVLRRGSGAELGLQWFSCLVACREGESAVSAVPAWRFRGAAAPEFAVTTPSERRLRVESVASELRPEGRRRHPLAASGHDFRFEAGICLHRITLVRTNLSGARARTLQGVLSR